MLTAGAATRVALLLFDGVDLLDAGGPYEVLLTANRLVGRDGAPPPFDVLTCAVDPDPVAAYGGLGLVPGTVLDDVGPVGVLVVPGTVDVAAATADTRLVGAVRGAAARAGIVTSVCTGALLLAAAGLLDGVPATTHHEDLDALAAATGGPVHAVPWVDAGPVVTAGGLSSGLAMALHLVDRLQSRDLAVRTAHQLAYAWDPDTGVDAATT